jgi:hypothetical protein
MSWAFARYTHGVALKLQAGCLDCFVLPNTQAHAGARARHTLNIVIFHPARLSKCRFLNPAGSKLDHSGLAKNPRAGFSPAQPVRPNRMFHRTYLCADTHRPSHPWRRIEASLSPSPAIRGQAFDRIECPLVTMFAVRSRAVEPQKQWLMSATFLASGSRVVFRVAKLMTLPLQSKYPSHAK